MTVFPVSLSDGLICAALDSTITYSHNSLYFSFVAFIPFWLIFILPWIKSDWPPQLVYKLYKSADSIHILTTVSNALNFSNFCLVVYFNLKEKSHLTEYQLSIFCTNFIAKLTLGGKKVKSQGLVEKDLFPFCNDFPISLTKFSSPASSTFILLRASLITKEKLKKLSHT